MRALTRVWQDFRAQGVVAGGGGNGLPPPSSFGSDLRTWLYQPGGQVLTVAAGTTLTGGAVDVARVAAAHPYKAGAPNNGWLVIAAEAEGQATIDLASTGLQWHGDSPYVAPRVLLCGFNVVNGVQDIRNVRLLWFWRCKPTFPIDSWEAQYTAANGGVAPAYGSTLSAAVLNAMANYTATPFRWDTCRDVYLVGMDFAHCGDDASYQRGCTAFTHQGNRWWDIYHHNRQWTSPWASSGYMHNDGIQMVYGGDDLHIYDSSMLAHYELAPDGGSYAGLDVRRNWLMASPYSGIAAVDGTYHCHGTIDDLTWGFLAQYINPSTDTFTTLPTYGGSGWDQAFVSPLSPGITATNIKHAGVDVAVPGGITATGNLLDDLRTAADPLHPNLDSITLHPSNPANVFRASYPYSAWASYFAGKFI